MPNLIENDALYQTALANNTSNGVVDRAGLAAELNEAHLDRADATYLAGATGLPVQADQDARVAQDNAPHGGVVNAALGTSLNVATAVVGGAEVPSYTGGNIVVGTQNTPMTQDAFDAVQAAALFTTGGQVPPVSYQDTVDLSDHVDGMFKAEASKLTGEKWF